MIQRQFIFHFFLEVLKLSQTICQEMSWIIYKTFWKILLETLGIHKLFKVWKINDKLSNFSKKKEKNHVFFGTKAYLWCRKTKSKIK